MLAAAWPGHAEAQPAEYVGVYETYQMFTQRDSQSFNEVLLIAGRKGFFGERFASCLAAREKVWLSLSKGAMCEGYQPGSVEKAQCYGQNPPSYLIRWSLSLRDALGRGTHWGQTEIGREIAAGEQLCGLLGAPELCQAFKAATQLDAPRMRALLVCP
jgi:hypothetical protein